MYAEIPGGGPPILLDADRSNLLRAAVALAEKLNVTQEAVRRFDATKSSTVGRVQRLQAQLNERRSQVTALEVEMHMLRRTVLADERRVLTTCAETRALTDALEASIRQVSTNSEEAGEQQLLETLFYRAGSTNGAAAS